MKTLLSRWSWVKIVEGILLILLGLLVGILGGIDRDNMTQALSIVIAVFLFIDGGITLFAIIVDPKKNFSLSIIFGALFIAIGAVLCTDVGQQSVQNILAIFVAVILLTCGGSYLIKSIVHIYFKAALGWIILDMVIAVAGIGLGVACLIYRDAEAINIIYIILGTSITVLGIFDIILAVEELKKKKEESPAQPEVVVTQHVDVSQNNIVEAKTKRTRKTTRKQLPMNDNNNIEK